MNTTIILAQVLGIIFTVIGLSWLLDKKGLAAILEESIRNRASLWLYGFITLIMGAVIIALNNVWGSGLQSLITLIGWLALIKGLFILLSPNTAISLYKKWNKPGVLLFGGLLAFILGLILLYKGFM